MAEHKTAQQQRALARAEEAARKVADECPHCFTEPEPGWIETPNNGPIVSCPVCNTTEERR